MEPRLSSQKKPTDVLSFATTCSQETNGRHGEGHARHAAPLSAASRILGNTIGDIAIAPAVARATHRFGRTFDDEMRILILHGILHLMGYDHETDTGQMERREQRLRRELGLA